MSTQSSSAAWVHWKPVRRYYLWRYRSETPTQISLALVTKTIDLDESASLVWERIDGNRPVQGILELLAERYPAVQPTVLEGDLFKFLMFLNNEKLIYIDWDPFR